jgi:hypothetical protein
MVSKYKHAILALTWELACLYFCGTMYYESYVSPENAHDAALTQPFRGEQAEHFAHQHPVAWGNESDQWERSAISHCFFLRYLLYYHSQRHPSHGIGEANRTSKTSLMHALVVAHPTLTLQPQCLLGK